MKKQFIYTLILVFTATNFLFVSCKKDKKDKKKELVASMTADGGNRPFPAEVKFTNSSKLAVEYHWDFGDGNESAEENPTHTYTEPGEFTVTLSVFGEDGETQTATRTVNIWNEIEGWTLNRVVADTMAFYDNAYEGDFIYLILKDHNDNNIDYYGNNQIYGYIITEDWDDMWLTPWNISDFDNAPIIVALGKNITVEIWALPEWDDLPEELLYQFTLNSDDFLPDDNHSAYPTSYRIENFSFSLGYKQKD